MHDTGSVKSWADYLSHPKLKFEVTTEKTQTNNLCQYCNEGNAQVVSDKASLKN